MFLFCSYRWRMTRLDGFQFTIEEWDCGGPVNTLAAASVYDVAKAAFEAACALRPGSSFVMRHGARIIAQN